MAKGRWTGEPASMLERRWGEMEEVEVVRGTCGGAKSGSSCRKNQIRIKITCNKNIPMHTELSNLGRFLRPS